MFHAHPYMTSQLLIEINDDVDALNTSYEVN